MRFLALGRSTPAARSIPPIDAEPPGEVRTAVFALG